MAEVTIRDLRKYYGGLEVIHGVNLDIPDGQFVVLVGPSGCGKTTVLRAIAGLVAPDDGDLLIDGESIRRLPPWRRRIGMVFQNYALYPHMSVRENMAFGLRNAGVAKQEIDTLIADAARVLEIEALLDRLERGAKRRVRT